MKHNVWSVVAAMLALVVAGCGGPGQTIPLSVNMDAVPAPEKMTAPLRVAVVPFEDVRSDKAKVGRYQHYVESTVDTLVPASGSAADQITNFVLEYLKRAGFQVTRVEPGQVVSPRSDDFVLSGHIESKEAKLLVPPDLPKEMDVARFAAWTTVARVLLNLDEFITRE